jgi:HD superfamily phosphohydrolase
MYTQVYLHHKTIGSDLLLRSILLRAKNLFQSGELAYHPVEVIPFFMRPDDEILVEEYLRLEEPVMIYAFHKWRSEEDLVLSDLASRFLDRRLYASRECGELELNSWNDMRSAFHEAGLDPEYYLIFEEIATAGFLYKEGIRVLDEQGRLQEIHAASKLIRSLVPEVKYRCYFPKEIVAGDGQYATLHKKLLSL